MKKKTFKIIISVLMVIAGIFYGFLVGEYEIFPYKIFKPAPDVETKIQDVPEYAIDSEDVELNDVEELISVNPANIEAIRSRAVSIICGQKDLTGLLPDKVYTVSDTAYSDILKLERIEQFEIIQEHNIKSIGYIFHPEKKNNKLLIYHQGHNGDFILGKNTIEYFVDKGFTVYAFCMPLLGKNNQPQITIKKLGIIHMKDNHEYFKFLDNPIGYFINPIIIMLNYAEDQGFEKIIMCGISGGGWTTTLAAGIDKRIDLSFPVAGTYPLYIRFVSPLKNYGDFEQTYPELYKEVNYLDLYLLGSIGKDRKQVQILNQYDPCCFYGLVSRHYEPYINEVIMEFENGSFKVIIDSTHKEHKISGFALEKIFEEMNSE